MLLQAHAIVRRRIARLAAAGELRRVTAVIGAMVACLVLTAVVLRIDPFDPPRMVQFLGRFHPAVVHLPIGALLVAAVFECAAMIGQFRGLRSAVPFVLLVGTAGAVLGVAAGYFLSFEGGYDPTLISQHKWLGIGVLVIAAGGLAISMAARSRHSRGLLLAQRIVVLAAAGLAILAGHLGGTLTRGPGYLTHYLPGFLSLGGNSSSSFPGGLIADVDSALVFDDLILPIMERRCVKCHGPSKSKGDLRLDGRAGIERGSRDGPILVAGNPGQSELIRRIVLPPSDEDVMPPRGEAPLDVGETELIRWWISAGASFQARTSEMPDAPTAVETYVARVAAPRQPQKAGIFALQVSEPDPSSVAAAERAGFTVRRLAPDAPFLDVSAVPIRGAVRNEHLAHLEPLYDQIASLDLSSTGVDALDAVGRMRHLTALHLQRTPMKDAALVHLAGLEHLEYLNLHGTEVSDAGLDHLARLERLRTLYLWNSAVSIEGAERLRTSKPALVVNVGSGFSERDP